MNVARCESSISTSRRQTRASEPRAMTTSLSAKWRGHGTAAARASCGRPSAAQDPALQRHPLVDPVLAFGDQAEHGLEIGRLGLRQEPDLAEVDAEQRARRPRRPRARPAGTCRRRPGRRGRPSSGAPRRSASRSPDWRLPTRRSRGPGTSRPRARSARRRPRSWGCRRTRSGETVTGAVRSRPRSGRRSSAQPGPARGGPGTRGCPPVRVSGEAMTSRVPKPEPCGRRATIRSRTSRWIGRIPDDAVVRPASPGLELRLDQRDDRLRPGASVAATGPRTRPSEMNDTSIGRERDGSGSVSASSVRAFVRSIETTRGSRRSDSASCPRPTSRA